MDGFSEGPEDVRRGRTITRRASVAALAAGAASLLPARAAAAPTPVPGTTGENDRARPSVEARDYGFAPGGDPETNTAALQTALGEARIVHLPNSNQVAEFNGPIRVPPGGQLVGKGPYRSRLRATGPIAFVCERERGLGDIEAPRFADFSLICAGTGIKLNSDEGGFTFHADSQQTLMRARLDRVHLIGPGWNVAGSRGIDFSRVFHAVLDQCTIRQFEIGVKTLGCDFPALVNRCRVQLCATLVQCESSATFGSGMLIDAADLLAPTHCFIRSSDHHLIVRDSYFEKQGNMPPAGRMTGPVLDIAHNYMTLISGNRFETPADRCPEFLKVSGRGGRPQGEGTLFLFEYNSYGGPDWGTTRWNEDNSARYFYNEAVRQQIIVRNNRIDPPTPFNNADDDGTRNERRDMWVITPGTRGLATNFNYTSQVRVRDGAFVLPARSGNGSLVKFKDRRRRVDGEAAIYILAAAAAEGQKLRVRPVNGDGSGAPAIDVTLGRDFAWHKVGEVARYRDLELLVSNRDTATGTDALIRMITVERPSG